MSGKELNKLAASILLASLIAMIGGVIANALYRPEFKLADRGFEVEVTEADPSSGVAKEPEPIDIPALMANANSEAAASTAKKCMACHVFEQGGPNKVGPHLWNVLGRKKGAVSDYKYSKALLAMGGVWDRESLYAFLRKPSKYMPGTKMSFAGIKKPQDIANMIAYMEEHGN